MLLTTDKSKCDIKQKIIVSRDKGNSRKHVAYNRTPADDVRQYQLDGDIIKQQTCCDYLLLNDTLRKAFFIELKGGNIDEAVPQLKKGFQAVQSEIKGYSVFYRIVCSKARTHNMRKSEYRKFKEECGQRLQCKEEYLEEYF